MQSDRTQRAHVCKGCGANFVAKKKENFTYCSRDCYFLHNVGENHHRFKGVRRNSCKVHFPKCVICADRFVARNSQIKTCSPHCKREHINNRARDYYRKSKQCIECGRLFCPLYGYGGRHCSSDCRRDRERKRDAISKRINAARRRALQRGSASARSVDPYKVFERDQWTCRACGCYTPKHLRGSNHDDAPELDHIVPLSKRGVHEHDNLQTLCRVCNILKSDKDNDDFIKEIRGKGWGCKSLPLSNR